MITIHDTKEGKTLAVNGMPQSSYPPPLNGYWKMMIPNKKLETVLMLGVGAGTVARMLLERFPDTKITGVEISQEVVNAAIEHLKLSEVKMNLVIADAFEYVFEHNEPYDLILVDIYDGYNFPLKFLMPKFVRRCQELLNKGGEMYFNTPSIEHGMSLMLPTRTKEDNGANTIYKYVKD